MAVELTPAPTVVRTLRLWPAVLAALALALIRFGVPLIFPSAAVVSLLGGFVAALAVLLWWTFFSRAPWLERLGALALMALALTATPRILDKSIATGMMGMMFFIHGIPTLSLAFAIWAVVFRRLSGQLRWASMAVTIFAACAAWALVRTGGITADGHSDFHWRWSQTPEERLLATSGDESVVTAPTAPPESAPGSPVEPAGERPHVPPTAPAPPVSSQPLTSKPGGKPAASALRTAPAENPSPALSHEPAVWPGFRGSQRDGVVRGVRIETDWARTPPVELWRRSIGPGWSSFAVRGDLLYTQEQRGGDEVVACYKMTTGEPVWKHRDGVRFWESNGGAGPRATPTLSDDRVYAMGATGILNVLNARTGAVVWSRNAASDTGAKVPYWGFSSSPLVTGDVVIVYAAALVAYDRATGHLRWSGKTHSGSYSSPQLLAIDGVPQILQMNGIGAAGVSPADGTPLWEHPWAGTTIVQPGHAADGDVLISTSDMGGGIGIRRIAVAHGPGGWTVEERWTSNGLKPYFNDFVVHKDHAYGFDGRILSCIDLQDGTRKWKGGRYGQGQLVLLADQDVLLVISEDGELALVGATPDQFREIARIPALEGKTWNHPVVAGDVLLVRNDHDMAAFRLSVVDNGDRPVSMNLERD